MKKIIKCQIRNGKLVKTFSLDKQPLCDDLIKIVNYIPNTKITIVSDKHLSNLKNSIIVINFNWHIKKEIRKYLRKNGLKNKIADIL